MSNFRIVVAAVMILALSSTVVVAFPTPVPNVQDVEVGKLVVHREDGRSSDCYVVTVTGVSPPADNAFVLLVPNRGSNQQGTLGRVEPRSGAIESGPADFSYVHIWVALASAAVPTTSTTAGALAVGAVASQGSNLWMRVAVYDYLGIPVDPGAGKIWAFKLNGGTVIQKVTDSVTVTRIDGDFRFVQGQ